MNARIHDPLPAPSLTSPAPDADLIDYNDDDGWPAMLPTRLAYYNPWLDPRYNSAVVHVRHSGRTTIRSSHPADDGSVRGGPLLVPDDDHPANLVSSLCSDGYHRPALDIDVPMVVLPSSSKGHHHVYFPTVVLDDARMALLLSTLEVCGILSPSHVAAVRDRGQTLLRPPHVRKAPAPVDDSDLRDF